MTMHYTHEHLGQENRDFANTHGLSQNNRAQGFLPAFRRSATGEVALARFADGRLAPCHLLDGLPNEWIVAKRADGRVLTACADLVSGFVRQGRFYTRAKAIEAFSAVRQS